MGTAAVFGLSALNAGIGAISNAISHKYSIEDMRYAADLNEEAARNADLRTRGLYKDIYSPGAILKQYKQAGLSPSLMYGGTPGQGGTSGAQGGTSALNTPYTPLSLIEGAQIANLAAQTEKTKAETKNIGVDTQRQEIAKKVEELQAGQYKTEWTILNSTWTENGKEKSLFEAARDHFSYDSFVEWCRSNETEEVIKEATKTEAGQSILRSIFLAANTFHRDIMVLSSEAVSSQFQMDIVNAMNNTEFAKLNAQAAVQFLRANIQAAELSETQKEAWNNLIDRLGKKGSTTRDIVVVLGMILNNAMCNWHMPSVNNYNTTDNSVRTINVRGNQ